MTDCMLNYPALLDNPSFLYRARPGNTRKPTL